MTDMESVIDVLSVSEIDCLRPLWLQLHAHHRQVRSPLETVAPWREPEDSWRVRREKYAEWLRSPLTRAFIARGVDGLLGYAMVRINDSPGSLQWGEQVGDLETLVVEAGSRGAGIGHALVSAARDHLVQHGVQVMRISVLAGNDAALRFYEREGATVLLWTLVMPTSN